jgi:hypothetical protein
MLRQLAWTHQACGSGEELPSSLAFLGLGWSSLTLPFLSLPCFALHVNWVVQFSAALPVLCMWVVCVPLHGCVRACLCCFCVAVCVCVAVLRPRSPSRQLLLTWSPHLLCQLSSGGRTVRKMGGDGWDCLVVNDSPVRAGAHVFKCVLGMGYGVMVWGMVVWEYEGMRVWG